jgi:hypothetical protein
MKQLVEFPLQAGGSLLVETEHSSREEGPTRVARGSYLIERAKLDFEEAIGRLRPAAEQLIGQLRDLSLSPDQITIEFGIKLSAEAGAIIAAVSAEGNYKVTLAWDGPKK